MKSGQFSREDQTLKSLAAPQVAQTSEPGRSVVDLLTNQVKYSGAFSPWQFVVSDWSTGAQT